jgi:hypothetical protein
MLPSFFRTCSGVRTYQWVINITLSAHRAFTGPDGIISERVVVAYLRGNVPAFLALRQAIDSALLLAAPTAQSSEAKTN